jgi:hypothetical protein
MAGTDIFVKRIMWVSVNRLLPAFHSGILTELFLSAFVVLLKNRTKTGAVFCALLEKR